MHRLFSLVPLFFIYFRYGFTATVFVPFPEPSPDNPVVNDNYLGISWELSSFDTLWGETPELLPNAMQNYLANIRARMNSPMRIRVGGSGMDVSSYAPDMIDQMIVHTDPNAYFNSVPVVFGPVLFDVLNKMSDNVGSMQFIIGLSLHNVNDADLTQTHFLAKAAENKLGDRLDALLLGNEPDFYPPKDGNDTYNLTDYMSDVNTVLDVLQRAPPLLNTKIMAGPATCCDKWPLTDVIQGGLGGLGYKYYAVQKYPIDACNGDTVANTNVTFFLDHSKVTSFATYEADGVALAKQQQTPMLLTEYNSVSCSGSVISDIFGMTLWTVDVALKFSSNNYSGAYLHTREYGRKYNLFDPPSADSSTGPSWRTGSPYYTTLVLAETLSPTKSSVVDLNLADSTIVSGVPTVAYAIYDNAGKTRGKLVLINYDVRQTNQDQTYALPSNLTDSVSIRYLLAPNITETTDISWAGQTVGENGQLQGQQHTEVMACRYGCNITVKGPGLALVLFTATSPDKFYQGDSSIVGVSDNLRSSAARVSLATGFPWIFLTFVFFLTY